MVSHYTNVKQRLLGYAVFPFRRICKSNTSNNFDGFSFNRFFATLYKRVLPLSALLLLSLLVLYSPVSPTPSAPFSPGLPPTPLPPPPPHTHTHTHRTVLQHAVASRPRSYDGTNFIIVQMTACILILGPTVIYSIRLYIKLLIGIGSTIFTNHRTLSSIFKLVLLNTLISLYVNVK